MPDNTVQTGGAGTNQGVNAGSERIEITQKELQSKIDAAVRAALETREKNLAKAHQEEIDRLNGEIERLKDEASKGSKSLEEQLKDAEEQKTKLAAEVKALKKQVGDLGGRFGSLLEAELVALGDEGKAKFEQICPEGLDDAAKLGFLAKVRPLLVGMKQDETEEENPAKGKPPITNHESNPPTEDEGFGKQMAEQKRAEENAASEEGYNPWGQ